MWLNYIVGGLSFVYKRAAHDHGHEDVDDHAHEDDATGTVSRTRLHVLSSLYENVTCILHTKIGS